MAKVAFLGLGVMGYPMAGHLKNEGDTRSPFITAPPPRPNNGSNNTAANLRLHLKPRRKDRISSWPALAMTMTSAK